MWLNFIKFWLTDFSEILGTTGKYCYLKVAKISKKYCDQDKNGITFSEATPKHNFTSSCWCVAHQNRDTVHVASFFLCWSVVLWHFLEGFVICCSFSSISNMKCRWEFVQIALLVSLNANPNHCSCEVAF